MTTTTIPNIEIRIRAKQETGYPIEITVETADNEQEYEGGHLNQNILPWVSSGSSKEDGKRLFEWMLADEQVAQVWHQLRGQYEQRRVRLRIDPDAAALHALPWETMRDSTQSLAPQLLAADGELPFARYVASPLSSPRPIDKQPLRVLVVLAMPSNLTEYNRPQADVAAESRAISYIFVEHNSDDLAYHCLPEKSDDVTAVTLSAIQARLEAEQPHILHLTAHIGFNKRRQESALLLAKADNQVELVRDTEFVAMLDSLTQPPSLIFLDTLAGADPAGMHQLALILVQAGSPTVLALPEPLPPQTSRIFGQTFYKHLLETGQADVAASKARQAIQRYDIPVGAMPILFSRLKDNQLLRPKQAATATANIEWTRYEPQGMVNIKAGTFQMGLGDQQHEVSTGEYWISPYPVTNQDYYKFVQDYGYLNLKVGWGSGGTSHKMPTEEQYDHPVVGVTLAQAIAYCDWLTSKTDGQRVYRLPTEAEWERAARGDDDARQYPWGDEWQSTRVHHYIEAKSKSLPNRRRGRTSKSKQVTPHQTTVPVTSHQSGVSPHGCFDMVGNAQEWTTTRWGQTFLRADYPYPPYQAYDDREDLSDILGKHKDYNTEQPLLRIARGGGYNARDKSKLTCSARVPADPTLSNRTLGFRVVMELKND